MKNHLEGNIDRYNQILTIVGVIYNVIPCFLL